jgi:hypothetical protein
MAKKPTKSAKPKNKSKPKPEPRAKAKPRPTQSNGDGYTDENTQALFLDWRRKIEPVEAKLDDIKKDLRGLYEKAKAEGFTKSDFAKARELTTEEGEHRLRADIERTRQLAKWLAVPLGSQLEMFADRTPARDQAAAEGKRDGLAGAKRKCDYDPNTEQYRAYMHHYDEGQAVLAKGIKRPEPPTPLEAAANGGVKHKDGEPVTSGQSVSRKEFQKGLQQVAAEGDAQIQNFKPGDEPKDQPPADHIGTERPTHSTHGEE